jgi:hypothetical protein
LYGSPDVAIVVKDSLHYSRVDQPVFNLSDLVCETLDPKIVFVSFLLVEGDEGKEECASFAMVLVVREEVQSVVVVVVPLAKGSESSFLYV